MGLTNGEPPPPFQMGRGHWNRGGRRASWRRHKMAPFHRRNAHTKPLRGWRAPCWDEIVAARAQASRFRTARAVIAGHA